MDTHNPKFLTGRITDVTFKFPGLVIESQSDELEDHDPGPTLSKLCQKTKV